MPINKTWNIRKKIALLPLVLAIAILGQTFGAEPIDTHDLWKYSVIDKIQSFLSIAQWKQHTQRESFGDTLVSSIQWLFNSKLAKNTQTTPLFASTNNTALSPYHTSAPATHIDGSVFFEDIAGHAYEAEISILASHGFFKKTNKFYPHNYVRLNDISKIIVHSYHISVGKNKWDATPEQFVQYAFAEWLLNKVINNVTPDTIEKIVTYADLQHIVDNIHKQYPSITQTIQIQHPAQEIVTKGAMAHYMVALFTLPLDQQHYEDVRYTHIQASPYAGALRALIENNIIPLQHTPTQQITRAMFIQQLVQAYARDKRVVIQEYMHNIADLDNQDPDTALIVYAHNQWRLDYILIQTKGQIFLDPDAIITADEVYTIIESISKKQMVTGIMTQDTPITQEKIAQILAGAFNIKPINNTTQSTQTTPSASGISLGQRIRSLFAQL